MSGLGGSLLGLLGLGSWDGGDLLSTGRAGLEGNPDGKPSSAADNLSVNDAGDNRLVNDSGDVLLYID